MKLLSILLISLALSGCSTFGWNSEKPITVFKKAESRTPLNLPDPKPLKPHEIKWIVITPENAEKVWADLRAKNIDLVLFALTDDGYEQLSVDTANTRNFIFQQREILIRYREYYESKPKADGESSKQP